MGVDLVGIAQRAAKTAFGIAERALEGATLHLSKDVTQNFHTDGAAEAGGTDKTTKGAFYHSRQQQEQAITNAGVFMILGEDVPDGIDEADSLTFTSGPRTGQTWQIAGVEGIPTSAVYILNIRR